MAPLRIKITLNKGRQGIAIEKLADVVKEAEKFLDSFNKDIGISTGEWIAEKFRNGSVIFDLVYIGGVEDAVLQNGTKAFRQLADPKTKPDDLAFGLTKSTFLQFARLASPLEEDDAIGIGIYNGSARPKAYNLSKKRAIQIEKEISSRVEQYASVQGVITALFKGGQSTLWITEKLTNRRVVCIYPSHFYKKIVGLLKDRDSLVNAEGWVTIINGETKDLRITTIEPLATYNEGDIERLFGADPDFTGGLSTEDYVDSIRQEAD